MSDNVDIVEDAYINRSPESIPGYRKVTGPLTLFGLRKEAITHWISVRRDELLSRNLNTLPTIVFIKDLSISSVEIDYHRSKDSILVFENDYYNT